LNYAISGFSSSDCANLTHCDGFAALTLCKGASTGCQPHCASDDVSCSTEQLERDDNCVRYSWVLHYWIDPERGGARSATEWKRCGTQQPYRPSVVEQQLHDLVSARKTRPKVVKRHQCHRQRHPLNLEPTLRFRSDLRFSRNGVGGCKRIRNQ
jgi:hypothetical protein